MKSTDLRAKARAIFGPAIAEPMPNQPNGAKALQQRANARPIPTYKVGGVVKSAPPGPTAAERAASKAQDERLKKAKVTPKEGKVIDSANRSEGSMYKKGGMAKGKAKDGLAVMIAIGKPMKGMKKPVKRALGGKIDAKLGKAVGNAKFDMARVAAASKVDPTNMPAGRGGMMGKVMNNPVMRAKLETAAAKAGVPIKRAVGGAGKTRKGMCK
jgi:hypothetical protein